MRLVDVVQRKVRPCGEEAIFYGTQNNQTDVLRKIFVVVLENTTSFTFVLAPGHEELGGGLVLGFPDNFPDEGELTLRNLVPDGQNVEKSCSEGIVRNAVLNHLFYGDFEDLLHISVDKDF